MAARAELGVTITPLTPPAEERSARSPLPATELGPALGALPAAMAAGEISVAWNERLSFPALVRRLSRLAGVAMRIEERPARIEGGAAALADPPALRLAWQGPLAGLLDRVAALSGYDWSWEALVPETLAPVHGAVVFHRYWDIEQRGPASADAAPMEDVGGSGAAVGNAGPWTVDPAAHGSLREVLESWAGRAGWTLVWKAGRDWRVGARAAFAGAFLEAADLLPSGPGTRRALDVRAYASNRHLVVDDADGAGW